jgi:hypothetical protein
MTCRETLLDTFLEAGKNFQHTASGFDSQLQALASLLAR